MVTDIAKLRELLAAATPEPYSASRLTGDDVGCTLVFYGPANGCWREDLGSCTPDCEADLIVALRNATPALLDELERLRKFRDAIMSYDDAIVHFLGDADGRDALTVAIDAERSARNGGG